MDEGALLLVLLMAVAICRLTGRRRRGVQGEAIKQLRQAAEMAERELRRLGANPAADRICRALKEIDRQQTEELV